MSIWRVITRNANGAEGYTSHTTLQAAVWQALNIERDGISCASSARTAQSWSAKTSGDWSSRSSRSLARWFHYTQRYIIQPCETLSRFQ